MTKQMHVDVHEKEGVAETKSGSAAVECGGLPNFRVCVCARVRGCVGWIETPSENT